MTRKLNKSHRSWEEEVIPLSNQLIPVSQFGIWQLLRRSNQTRMNHFVRSLIWIQKVVENDQEVAKNLIGAGKKELSHFQIS